MKAASTVLLAAAILVAGVAPAVPVAASSADDEVEAAAIDLAVAAQAMPLDGDEAALCPRLDLEVVVADATTIPDFEHGAYLTPFESASDGDGSYANGVVVCQTSDYAVMGFEAIRGDSGWTLHQIPGGDPHQLDRESTSNGQSADPSVEDDDATVPTGADAGAATHSAGEGATDSSINWPTDMGPVEDLASYDPQDSCHYVEQPGTQALRSLLTSVYPTTGPGNILRGCGVGGTSEHKDGRAYDWSADVGDPTDRAAVEDFLEFALGPDPAGNEYGGARRMGLMYIVWNRQMWRAYRDPHEWKDYTGASPHTDHVHLSLSWDGARCETSYWEATNCSGVNVGQPDPPPPPPPPPTPPVVERVSTFYPASSGARVDSWDSSGSNFDYVGEGGSWEASDGYPLDQVGDRMVAGDFDGDGHDDIATFFDTGSGATLHVWLRDADGGGYVGPSEWWAVESGYTLGRVDGRMVAGDFDGNGREDIATLYDYGDGASRVHTWLSTGDRFGYQGSSGWWATASGYTPGNVRSRMVAGDFDGDGRDDVTTMYGYSGGSTRLHTFRSTGSGFSWPVTGWRLASGYDSAALGDRMVAGDFDGDGNDDLAAFHDDGGGGSTIHAWLAGDDGFDYQDGSGWWSVASGYTAGNVGARMIAGDFDDDGRDDVATMYGYSGGTARLHTFLSTGSHFSWPQTWWNVSSGYDASDVHGRIVAMTD